MSNQVVLQEIEKLIDLGQTHQAFQKIKQATCPSDGLHKTMQLRELLRKCGPLENPVGRIRIAVGGDANLNFLIETLQFHLQLQNLNTDIYLCPFATVRQQILNPTSELYSFQPDFLWFFSSEHDLKISETQLSSKEQVEAEAQVASTDLEQLLGTFRNNSGARILLNNFDSPSDRIFGHYSSNAQVGRPHFIELLNQKIANFDVPDAFIFDYGWIASLFGLSQWSEKRHWYQTKLPFHPAATTLVSFHASQVIGSLMGLVKKCLVVDLDNTLWGGVVAELGPENIQLDNHHPEGEAFLTLQSYLLALKDRGVLLAACSKNDLATAQEPFIKNKKMRLKLSDFCSFKASWRPKPEAIQEIAKELGIGLSSCVFLDDNIFERNLVRSLLPEVTVPELPDDCLQFLDTLDQARLFEISQITNEDHHRTEMYQGNILRHDLKKKSNSLEEYLQSLTMTCQVEKIEKHNFDRVLQLIQKTNQFNLTSIRKSQGALSDLICDETWLHRVYHLRDRFGDNGIVCCVLARENPKHKSLEIETWVMSCRVLQRGLEHFVHDDLVAFAKSKGLKQIRGLYRQTDKNSVVKNLFSTLGYRKESHPTDDNAQTWTLDLDGQVSQHLPLIQRAHEL